MRKHNLSESLKSVTFFCSKCRANFTNEPESVIDCPEIEHHTPKEKIKDDSDVDPFDRQEQQKILSLCPNDAFRNLFQFALWTGLRTSELVALDWSDIDFVNHRGYLLQKQ